MIKEDLIYSYNQLNQSLNNLLNIVEENDLKFSPHSKSMNMEELIKHLQSIELVGLQGLITGYWPRGKVTTNTESKEKILFTLNENHKQAMKFLDELSEEDLIHKTISLPFPPDTFLKHYLSGSLHRLLYFWLEHIIHHRTQLFLYLKILNNDVNSMSIWGY